MSLISKIKRFFFEKNALGSFFWFTFLGYIRPAINIFLLPLYLKCISPEEYGILALVGVFTSVAMTFSNLKIDTAVRTFYFDYNHNEQQLWTYLSQIFSFSLFSIILYFVLFLCIGPTLYQLSFESEAIHFYPYGVLSMAAAGFSLCTSIYFVFLKNQLRLKSYASYTLFNIGSTVALQAYFILYLDMGILGILIGTLIPNILVLLGIIIQHPKLITFCFHKHIIVPSLRFAFPLIPVAFLMAFEKQLDKLLLERYMSLGEVGIYAILVSIVGLSNILLTALDNAIRPFLYEDLKELIPANITRISNYRNLYFLVGLIGLSGIIMIGSNFHLFTDNERYLRVRPYFTMACIAFIPFIFVRYYGLIYVFYKKSGSLTLITFLKAIVVVILLLVLVPYWGIAGGIAATLISNIFNQIIFAQQVKYFGAPKLSLNSVMLKVVIFLAIVGITYYSIAEQAIEWYGILQFCLISSLLVFLDRKNLLSMAKNRL